MAGIQDPELNAAAEDIFDIAAVCRLTGLTAPALRMWEKRHQAVNPGRTETGRRQYTRRDIHRLTLLKALSDQGHGIRTLVGLPLVELERRLEEGAKVIADAEGDAQGQNGAVDKRISDQIRSCRIVAVGGHLTTLLESEDDFFPESATVQKIQSLKDAEGQSADIEADLLIVEIPALFGDDLNRVRRLLTRLQALRAIVIYAYAQDQTLEQISENDGIITAIRAPISLAELREVCKTDVALANRSVTATIENAPQPQDFDGNFRERKFSNPQLARVATVSSAVECECPNHLANLLEALNGFEEYSAQCENRNAADAKIHAYLHMMTAHARATIEDALEVLVEFEDIDVGKKEAD